MLGAAINASNNLRQGDITACSFLYTWSKETFLIRDIW